MENLNIDEMSLEELNALLKAVEAKIAKMEGGETEQNGDCEDDKEQREGEAAEGEEEVTVDQELVDKLPDAIEALEEIVDQVGERKKTILGKAEKRNKLIEKIAAGKVGTEVRKHPGVTEKEEKPMTELEVRKSPEYAKAFLRGMKINDYAECRALLSTNGTSETLSLTGYVPVPEFLETEIKTAWEDAKLLSLVKHTTFKGNVKVGFELSATGAKVHAEGDSAPDEEVITLGVVEIKAESLKKWITVSDEALEGTTVDTMGYLYKEIAQKIAELAEELIVGMIGSAPTTSTSSAVSVQELVITEAKADTIVKAVSLLNAQAKDLNIVMHRQTYPAFVAVAMSANYGIDVWDGLKDKIIFSNALEPIGTAEEDDLLMIVGDFGFGAQANFPNGNDLQIKVDNLSLAEKDLVKLVGRQYVGLGLVAENAFVRVVMGDTTP